MGATGDRVARSRRVQRRLADETDIAKNDTLPRRPGRPATRPPGKDVTFWCPSDVLEALDKLIRPRKPGTGKSATIVALRQYLDKASDDGEQGV
jgi:hypothetical protein